jgi:hypothetical protein
LIVSKVSQSITFFYNNFGGRLVIRFENVATAGILLDEIAT